MNIKTAYRVSETRVYCELGIFFPLIHSRRKCEIRNARLRIVCQLASSSLV